jgi:hypothetical protein
VIVYNLICERTHKFEGWFSSKDDFDHQLAAQKISCPVCASVALTLLPSGPRVTTHPAQEGNAASKNARHSVATANSAAAGKLLRAFIEQFENVGTSFAEEARSMHYGEKPHRNIRGQVSYDVASELHEEGIEVAVLPSELDFAQKLN